MAAGLQIICTDVQNIPAFMHITPYKVTTIDYKSHLMINSLQMNKISFYTLPFHIPAFIVIDPICSLLLLPPDLTSAVNIKDYLTALIEVLLLNN